MSERLLKKGRIEELNVERVEVAARIEAAVGAVKSALALASVTTIEELDLDAAALHANEAARLRKRYLQILKDIKALKKELG